MPFVKFVRGQKIGRWGHENLMGSEGYSPVFWCKECASC
jgi:hypothetical protein